MSFSIDDGIALCKVIGGEGDGEIVFLDIEGKKKSKVVKNIPIRKIDCIDGSFRMIPNDIMRVHLVSGPAGAGKSTLVASYSKSFKKLYPDNKILLFSRVNDDPAFHGIDFKRVTITEDLIKNPLQLEEVTPGSLVIFDDVDTISNEQLLNSVLNFEAQILEMGRHNDVKIFITSHLINGPKKTHTSRVMNELHSFTFFPQSGSVKQINYNLSQYFGLTTVQIRKIMSMESRWVTLFKSYPQILLTEHLCMFISNL